MLVDVADRSLQTTLLGRPLPAPLLLAPIGVLEMAHPEADLAAARAARSLGIPMVISTQGSVPMEETARALGESPRLYQLYWSSDETVVRSLVERAEAIGSDAIVVTLDTHLLGWRTRDLDLGYLPFARGEGIAQYLSDPAFAAVAAARPASTEPTPRPTVAALRSLVSMARHHARWAGGSGGRIGSLVASLRSSLPRASVETFLDVFSRSDLTWADLERLREMTSLPILVKGVQHPADARLALEHGVDGLVVSNHGGRQVDNAIASLDALPAVVAEVAGRVPVLFDSGVRSGADVAVALALGADAVLLGRPWVYGLALAGEAGVRAVLEHVLAELDLTMGLAGVACVDQLGPSLLEA
jgi:L-lactate dehydrogenase (cytochrome)/lactate 2-monooxygenase